MSKVRQTFIDAVTKLGKETITTADIKNIMADTGDRKSTRLNSSH